MENNVIAVFSAPGQIEMMRKLIFAAALAAMPAFVNAQVVLPKLVADHMVLQRDQPLKLWGWAAPGENVTVTFLGKSYKAKADANRRWQVTTAPAPAGGPHNLVIKGKGNTVTLTDVLVGDVWLASGQSNMEWKINQKINNWQQEAATANYPQIRVINVDNTISYQPLDDIRTSGWQLCTPEAALNFSAIGYMFSRSLHQNYKVPVGLIQSEWGGTPAEAWTSLEALKPFPHYVEKAQRLSEENKQPQAAMEARHKAAMANWGQQVNQLDKGFTAIPPYQHPDASTNGWGSITLPGKLEDVAADFDGIAWLRRDFTAPKEFLGMELTLLMAKIDDVDSIWVNGVPVGGMSGFSRFRSYRVKPGIVKPGKNTVVVRLLDMGGDGGIMGNNEDMKIHNGNEIVPLHGTWQYKITHQGAVPAPPSPSFSQNDPTALFNGMISPLVGYGIKGVIWYQGESNAPRAHEYRTLFPAMITDWRTRWGRDFPFLYVQLANYRKEDEKPVESDWAELREAQAMALKLPNTGMVTAIDIGEANDIHPRNKQDVAQRLVTVARKVAYGENLPAYGPMFKSAQPQGNKMVITFSETAGGLVCKDRYGYVKGFAVAGPDKQWHYAKAEVTGPDQVTVYCDKVGSPVAVRYAWANNPGDNNLYNSAGLPAFPFRSDDWPGVTVKK